MKQPNKRNTLLPLLLCTNQVCVYHPRLYSTQNVLGAGLMASYFLLQPHLMLRKKDSWADWRIRNSVGAQGMIAFVWEVEIISKPQMERGTAQKKKKHLASETSWSRTTPRVCGFLMTYPLVKAKIKLLFGPRSLCQPVENWGMQPLFFTEQFCMSFTGVASNSRTGNCCLRYRGSCWLIQNYNFLKYRIKGPGLIAQRKFIM